MSNNLIVILLLLSLILNKLSSLINLPSVLYHTAGIFVIWMAEVSSVMYTHFHTIMYHLKMTVISSLHLLIHLIKYNLIVLTAETPQTTVGCNILNIYWFTGFISKSYGAVQVFPIWSWIYVLLNCHTLFIWSRGSCNRG